MGYWKVKQPYRRMPHCVGSLCTIKYSVMRLVRIIGLALEAGIAFISMMTYEQTLGRLDEIMASLENEQIGLDESLKLFEEGIELLRSAAAELDRAETRVQLLIEKSG